MMRQNNRTASFSAERFELECITWGELLCRACLEEEKVEHEDAPRALRIRAEESWALLKKAREIEPEHTGLSFALSYLAAVFELEQEEQQVLLLALLPELEKGFEEYYARLEPSGRGSLTLGLALRLLGGAAGLRLRQRQDSLLMEYCFEPDGRRERFFSRTLRPAARISSFVLGENWERPEMEGLVLLHTGNRQFPEKLLRTARQMQDYLKRAGGEQTTFLLAGQRGAGRRTLAGALAKVREEPLLLVDGRRLFGPAGNEFRLELLRECVLQRCPVCVTGLEEELDALWDDREGEDALCAVLKETARFGGCSMLLTWSDWTPAEETRGWRMMPVELGMPTLEESRELWSAFLARYPVDSREDPEQLAGKYRFTPGQMERALERAWACAGWRGIPSIDDTCIEEGCRSQLRHALGKKARKVERLFSWEDLILPTSSKLLLRSACDQIKYRRQVYDRWGFGKKLPYGNGLSMLFSGPPGTGKTMAAQIAAGELGLELYKVELPAVVSKYVGETEKNLDQIFREASRSQAILFFDEADVLFGKRTEVKDAHDKYNNMEAAYLLQKMEEYSGVSVLATNFLQNFDEAFKRRIRFIIEFPFPNGEYRKLLWQSVFPAQTPLGEDVDWDFLAQNFELSGSAIKNVAVNAAFLAAERDGEVGMTHLLIALRRELQKSGKTVTREDFGPYYMLAEREWDDA